MKASSRESGFGAIEMVVALALLGVLLVSVVGMHMLVLSAGTAAETSTVASNLARARMEELLSLPPSQILEQDGAQALTQVPTGQGRIYAVHTAVSALTPDRFDITVTVTWQVTYGSACASGASGPGCAGSTVTFSRTLETRVHGS